MIVRYWGGWPMPAFAVAVVVAGSLTGCGQAKPVAAAGISVRPHRTSSPSHSASPRPSTSASAASSAPVENTQDSGICSWPAHTQVAAELSSEITSALSDRDSTVDFTADDPGQGLTCTLRGSDDSHSASIVKVIILAALMYENQPGTSLSSQQKSLAWQMITASSDSAATDLWNDVGMEDLQEFLSAAGMDHTYLGQDGYWGLTEVNPDDELRLLQLLITPNSVLDTASRDYILYLMRNVISYDYWGVSAGVPSSDTVYLKNGWLPDPTLWVINTIGDIATSGGDYSMAILSRDNPSMSYGVDTVESVATLINQALASH
jgi:beta-lactamase class A